MLGFLVLVFILISILGILFICKKLKDDLIWDENFKAYLNEGNFIRTPIYKDDSEGENF